MGSYFLSLMVMEGMLFGCLSNNHRDFMPAGTRGSIYGLVAVTLAAATLFPLLLEYFHRKATAKSLSTIAAVAARICNGDSAEGIPQLKQNDVGDLARSINDMVARIEGRLAELAAERNRLYTILSGMGEGVLVTDAMGVITMVNPAFLTLFSIQEGVERRPIIEIVRHPALNEALKRAMTTRDVRIDEITLQLDNEKTILTHWAPLLENGEIRGVVGVFHDISALKRLEKVRRDFVANVSHELRTPVTVIKGYAEILLSGEVDTDAERSARFVGIIHNHAERLSTLIGDLLALSELESGDLTLELVPLNISGPVRRSWNLLEQKAHHKDIYFDWSGIENLPTVMADPGRIEQVLINLLDNAIKYTPKNGSVSISASETGSMVTVRVSDTGMGIPPQDQSRIFERFYRVNKARSGDEGGTGLGLSIVKHIVQLHGGTISVESIPGKGSTFSFTLKIA